MKHLTILLCTLALSTVPAFAGGAVEELHPAAPDAEISIDNLSGSVKVHGWDRGEVRITGTLGDDVEGLDVTGDENEIKIEVDFPEGEGNYGDLDADLEIWVPAGARVSVETVSASISAEGVRGALDLETVSGSVAVDGQPSSVEVEAVSGSIAVNGSGTRASVEAVSGSIALTGVSGSVEVETVSGSVAVAADEIERGSIESVSGRIEIDTALAPGARLDIDAHSADVVLKLPAATSASFEVTTFSGGIDNEFGPPAERTDEYAPGKRLEFATGSGDARVSIETFSGNVKLKQQ